MGKDRLVPVIKVNNRRVNLEFYAEKIGFSVLLEDGSVISLGDRSKQVLLELDEFPAARALKVEGKKKLSQLVFRASDPREVEAGLARGVVIDRLYKGKKGWGYRTLSPEGDRILLHAEEKVADLVQVAESDYPTSFEQGPAGFTQLELEELHLNVEDEVVSRSNYERLDWPLALHFNQAQGDYLKAPTGKTWDLYQLRLFQEDWDLADLVARFSDRSPFVPKNGKFILIEDGTDQLEWWVQGHE